MSLGSKLLGACSLGSLHGDRSLSLFFGFLVTSMHHSQPTPFLCSGSWPTPTYSLLSATTGVETKSLRVPFGPSKYFDPLGLQSNFHNSSPSLFFERGSKL